MGSPDVPPRLKAADDLFEECHCGTLIMKNSRCHKCGCYPWEICDDALWGMPSIKENYDEYWGEE